MHRYKTYPLLRGFPSKVSGKMEIPGCMAGTGLEAAGQVRIHVSTSSFGGELKTGRDQFPTGKLWKRSAKIC